MYNTFYRSMIVDNDARKFLDTFVGPTVSAASSMRIFRNGLFSLSTRIGLGLFVPLTRERTLYLLRFFTFTLFKQTIFSELYLHQRLWRHIFENGCGLMGLSTYYAVFRINKAYQESKKPKDKIDQTYLDEAPENFSAIEEIDRRRKVVEEQPTYPSYVGPYNSYDYEGLPGYLPINESDDTVYTGFNQAAVDDVDNQTGFDYDGPHDVQFNRFNKKPPSKFVRGLNGLSSAIVKLKDVWLPVV